MKKYYYLFTLTFVFVVPAVIAGIFLSNYISLAPLIPFIFFVTIIGSIWDVWASKHGKKDTVWIWQFNDKETLGVKIFGLPAEEYLFYVVSSVYVIFMWEGIKLIMQTNLLATYLMVLALGAWTLLAILLPYWLGPKGDRFIG